MEAYAKLIQEVAEAIREARKADLPTEEIAAALTKLAELVESEG